MQIRARQENAAVEYGYDANGNLTKDLNKNITSISYNSLNLPGVVSFANGNTVTYGYDAAGSKLSVAYKSGANVAKTEYAGNKVYRNGTLSMILTEEGYITLSGTTPTYHYFLKDHQGNNRVVINQSGAVQQVNHYYPFGGLFGEGMQTSNQPYKFNGKELDRQFGLDMYDYGARHYDAAIGRWGTPDPLAEKYYSVSSYVYCGNNPVRNIDLRGDSVTVLNLNGGEHSAMLIQNDEGRWQYYSMNGDWVYDVTSGWKGGKPYHDMGEKTFNSPQEFLKSTYNTEGNKEKVNNNTVDNYGFTEGYVLPTTPEQDNVIRSTFTDICANENYRIFSNNCATTVQRSLNAAGINTSIIRRETDAFISTPPETYNSWLPSEVFRAIRTNNPNGIYIKRK